MKCRRPIEFGSSGCQLGVGDGSLRVVHLSTSWSRLEINKLQPVSRGAIGKCRRFSRRGFHRVQQTSIREASQAVESKHTHYRDEQVRLLLPTNSPYGAVLNMEIFWADIETTTRFTKKLLP